MSGTSRGRSTRSSSRNAHFNLRTLGARVTEYLVNQYGPMDDGVNRGDETDRVMVTWALAAPPAPTPRDDEVVASVEVPHDIEALRRDAPTDAAAWRRRVREAFVGHLASGTGRRRVRRRARLPVRPALSGAAPATPRPFTEAIDLARGEFEDGAWVV